MEPMVRMLLRPGWIVTHVIVVTIAVLFISLGLWQLERHDERQDEIARTEAAIAAPPAPLDDVLATGDVQNRPASATGSYLAGEQLQLSPRSNAQRPGYEVLTPLALDDGRTLVVNRGWMPLDEPLPAPPQGTVTVTGRLQPPATARQVLPADGDRAELVSSVDLDLLDSQVGGLVTTAYLERVDDDALEAGTFPRPAGPVDLDAGNHLSYAFQWFAFTAVGLIGYPLLLRRRIREGHHGGPDHRPAPQDTPEPPGTSGRVETSRVSQ